ncbi:MAG TPA: DUF2461 domain-containing protein [Bacillota bacterium]|nr:DUF2461 domain-containing protein [Bacillota bacterium]
MEQNFTGFSPEALVFLQEIRLYNSKTWYTEHKPEYRRLLLQPFQSLVADLSETMLEIDPALITQPAVDKTISRIYRDTRFSKDKSLYRDSMWLNFKRPGSDWKEAPTYFFEVTPNWYRYGMGFYITPKGYMDKFRELLLTHSDRFLQIMASVRESGLFEVEGDCYKRLPQLDVDPEVREWLRYKNFFFSSHHPIDDQLFEASLVERIRTGFKILAPVYNYLWEIKLQVEAENKAAVFDGFSF